MKLFSSTRYHLLLSFSLLIILGMISSFGARAFGTAARAAKRSTSTSTAAPVRFGFFPATTTAAATTTFFATLPTTTARFMSSSEPPDTSVVETCTQKIGDALETSDVKVTGAYDDPNGSHISIEVVSALFEGKRQMQRQQLVYKAIWDELQGPVHAVDSMICKTPEEE